MAESETAVAATPRAPFSPTLASRREQMFPRLDPGEIQRLARFGDPQRYTEGEYLARVGDPGVGLIAVLGGAAFATPFGYETNVLVYKRAAATTSTSSGSASR